MKDVSTRFPHRAIAWLLALPALLPGCAGGGGPGDRTVPEPQYTLTRDQTHNKFSAAIPPVLRVRSGAVIEAFTEEATDGQLSIDSTAEEMAGIDFDLIHPLTGPVFVEGAMPGDILAVTLHEIEIGDWGWTAIVPGFGFLADEFPDPAIRTWRLGADRTQIEFADGITVPLHPFAGVMGVAPDTGEMLSTIPPRANGGNMDDPHLVAGTTVYFPVFVEGALFSIGDTTRRRASARCAAPRSRRRCGSSTS